MVRRLAQGMMFGLLILGIACSASTPTPKSGGDALRPQASVEIGRLLFNEAPWPNLTDSSSKGDDPIRVPLCLLTVLDKVEVPSREEGAIAWLGVELKEGENVDPKDLYIHIAKKRPDSVEQVVTRYRRLRVGERVQKGQVIALLDHKKAELDHMIAISNIQGATKEWNAATEGIKHYRAILKIEMDAGSSKQGIVSAEANLAKAKAEEAAKQFTVERTKGEEKKAQEKLDDHQIRAPIAGDVVHFSKQVGEGVKATEPVLLLQNTDRLGVEGLLPLQYARRVSVGAEVYLEPSIMEAPWPGRSPHTSNKPITAVAVGICQGKQAVVSASEDGSVHVWGRGKVFASWKHRDPVRALACTGPGVEAAMVLTGCDDGKARIWSLRELGAEPVLILDGHHEGGVQAAAFSPNGAHLVTADDRGDIMLWDTAAGKKLYTFPREHNSAVISLHFTPQCRVVSAGRDSAALVWRVGDKSASVETRFDHRAGEVGMLGVSDDGGQMLLDLDKNRLRIVELGKNYNLGTLQQSGDGGKFTSFALMSPVIGGKEGDRVIMTTSGTDGVLQLWRWSAAGRGTELRKLVCTNYVPPSCAAFSPKAKDGFIAVGTKKGDVHLWPIPTEEEITGRFRAKVTHIAENSDSSGKTVRIFADYENPPAPGLRLRPGTTATLVIPQ